MIFSRLRASKNVMILGPNCSGKSTLILYLQSGYVTTDMPHPTMGAFLVDRVFEVGDKSGFIKIIEDIGGSSEAVLSCQSGEHGLKRQTQRALSICLMAKKIGKTSSGIFRIHSCMFLHIIKLV